MAGWWYVQEKQGLGLEKSADKSLVTITISAIDRADHNATFSVRGRGTPLEEGRDHVMTNLVSARLWKLDNEAIMKKVLVRFRWMALLCRCLSLSYPSVVNRGMIRYFAKASCCN